MSEPGHAPRLRRGWRVLWLVLATIGTLLLSAFVATGLVLQHTADLALDIEYVTAPSLTRWYEPIAPTEHRAFRSDGRVWAQLGDRLFLDGEPLTHPIGTLRGALAFDPLTLLADDANVWVVDEAVNILHQLPAPAAIEVLGTAGGWPAIDTLAGVYVADRELRTWIELDESTRVEGSPAMTLDALELERLRRIYLAELVTVERLLLDLHSGRLFGRPGTVIIDVAGVFLILLAVVAVVRLWRGR